MNRTTVLSLAFALTASLHADIVPTVFGRLAKDSAEVRSLYGATVFSNPASRVGIQVAEPGVLRFTADTLRSEGTEGFSTKVGFLLPLAHRVEPRNLTGLRSIQFDLKLSEIPTGGVRISIRSTGYGGTHDQEGNTFGFLLHPAVLPEPDTWKTFSIDITELDIPTSFTPEPDYPGFDSILTVPEALQFSPVPLYSGDGTLDGKACSLCVDPTTTKFGMEIRALRLVGALNLYSFDPHRPTEACRISESSDLDDFVDGNLVNGFGGHWMARTDTTSDPARAQDSSRGTSQARIEVEGDPDRSSGFLRFRTVLNKNAAMHGDFRPFAGWAELSTDFGKGALQPVSIQGYVLHGFSFSMKPGNRWKHVRSVRFKAQTPGTPLDQLHQVEIALPYFHPESATYVPKICVSTEDLKQPFWVRDRKPLAAHDFLERLIWEVALESSFDSAIVSDSVDLFLSGIRVHGFDYSMRTQARPSTSLPVHYRQGRLTVDPPSAGSEVLVVSPSGRIAAHFQGKVQDERLHLERGAWKVVVRDPQGRTLVRTLAVVR